MTSASHEVAEKSFQYLKQFSGNRINKFSLIFLVSQIISVIKEYKASGPLLKYLTSEKSEAKKEYIFGILFQVTRKFLKFF